MKIADMKVTELINAVGSDAPARPATAPPPGAGASRVWRAASASR